MGTGQVVEFALEGGSGVDRPVVGARRRGMRRWLRSPGPWVTVAVMLVMAGVVSSPRGETAPATAWTIDLETGSTPGVWAVDGVVMATTADALVALDPADGTEEWALPMRDPTCTEDRLALICVHGQGPEATVTTVEADGSAQSMTIPGAQVAAATDTGLVLGGQSDDGRWLRRVEAEGDPLWEHTSEGFGTNRWQAVAARDGIVVADASASRSASARSWSLTSVNLETGDPATMAFPSPGGMLLVMDVDDLDVANAAGPQTPVWLSLERFGLPEYPGAVVTLGAVLDGVGGSTIMQFEGRPVAAVGSTVYTADDSSSNENELRAYDAISGAVQWSQSLPSARAAVCPCAASDSSLLLVTGEPQGGMTADLSTEALALAWYDRESGQSHGHVDVSPELRAMTADESTFFVLVGSTVTAYPDPVS
ncbi:PQQ-binding-like beta-propeller repeat protein [Ruania alba]|uniref:Pyrrolo-quinoline quinone repeat domain-containing protein n=1 Tax=Ruania alba TaxID=648782 RepID=A0A1H5BK76_9MICO|nr:PQQ-binding-like beta-propeller repeat protein [Ruania alba]SED55029.1 hypothetical protein SAMN04488554_0131 [Ruania alba]